ncbi:MAG TPA: methyltransferase, partial [Candidatus Nanopelagicales bacterium]|nr:methyltransferase [Candidatus Nanopelagicales bacterium]
RFFDHFGVDRGGALCGIGTVKTNIGHLESAAGIAGIIKVILSLQHQQLPASLHFTELNPHIDLEGSPLFVVRRPQSWEPPRDAEGHPLPRRAGVSSFGFGGVNAHVIVEEHHPAPPSDEAGDLAGASQEIVVLSAKSEERLAEHARRLVAHLRAKHPRPRLADVAFTLQVGRQHFEHRLAILARSVEELIEKLEEHAGGLRCAGLWSGRCLPSSHALRLLGESAEGVVLIDSLMRKGAVTDVARLWVEGVAIPWASFPRARGERRVPLPGYPFTAIRCWIEEDAQATPRAAGQATLPAPRASAEGGASSILDAMVEPVAQYLAEQRYDTEEIDEGLGLLNQLGHRMLLHALRGMGILNHAGQSHAIETLERELGIDPFYGRLFQSLLEILEGAGLVRISGGSVAATEAALAPEYSDPAVEEQLRRRLSEEHGYIAPVQKVLTVSIAALPEILTGEKDYVDVLFPGGEMSLMEPLYRGNEISDYYNRLVAVAVRCFVERRLAEAPDARIDILEIGAGTGGTTAFVLEALKDHGAHVTYWYTDISVKFTQHGEEHFGHVLPDMCFKALDLEKDARSQGFEPGLFDLALGTNVLHATSDIKASLERIHELLRPGGLLLLNELTRVLDFMTLTFGLIKGWWLFQDPELRMRNSPLLDVGQWRAALEQAGFGGVIRFGVPDADEDCITQNVIASERRPRGGGAEQAVAEARLPAALPFEPAPAGLAEAPGGLEGGLQELLKQVFSRTLKIPVSSLDAQSSFAQFGIDSLISIDIVKRLEAHFGRLQRGLLFEHITIAELARYFAEEHKEKSLAVLAALKST